MIVSMGVGFGIGAMVGFCRAFYIEYPQSKRAQDFPFNLNIVSASGSDVGVQMVYKLSF